MLPEPEHPGHRWRLCLAFERRRLPVEAEVSAGAGKVNKTVNIWCPAVWLNTTRAFKPLARHRSYSAVKSAAMTAGCCDRHEVFTAHAPSPLTMLAHVGAHGKL
jgi:hypothetical protein